MQFGLESIIRNKVRLITFCNTRKKNALSVDAYNEIANILQGDAANDAIIGTIFTGKGDYFTSGNDLSVKMDADFDFEKTSQEFNRKFARMIDAIIKYPKLIVSVVNGPAIGIGFTLTGLSDIAYASQTAVFSAPFVKLGLCIEGCGSYLMPRILGKSKASEVLLLGRKMSAEEALQYNLISRVIPQSEVRQCIDEFIDELSQLPLEPIIYNKKLMTDNVIDGLEKCAEREKNVLMECQTSEFFLNNMMNFMNKRKPSKM